MGEPLEAKGLGELNHLRMKNSVFPGAVQDRQIRVINNAAPRGIPQTYKRLMKKTLHQKAIKVRIEFNVAHFGIPQVKSAGDQSV